MNQSPSSPAAAPPFAAFIGLDWADQKHAWALQEAGSQHVEQGQVDNTPEAMHAWVTELTSRFIANQSPWLWNKRAARSLPS